MSKEKLWNFRPNPGQKEWVKSISSLLGKNMDSEVLRAAIWYFQQCPDPLKVVRKYKMAQIDEAIPLDFKKRASQAFVLNKKKSPGRAGRAVD